MERLEHRFTAMGGPATLRLEHTDPGLCHRAIDAAVARVSELEQRYSRYLPDSLVTRINERAGTGRATAIDPETAGLLRYADTLWQQSDGRFDLTAGVLRGAWNFRSGELPAAGAIEALLPLIRWLAAALRFDPSPNPPPLFQ